ncbi:MAG: hypothetical protein LBL57_07750 [Tannerella sp.]|jgi:hypothetical protein|nr:hypothetical protein [Tannerella sp.]
MERNDLISDFTSYIENLCRQHTVILHSAEKKHFVRLDSDEMLQGERTGICYPVVTLERLTVSYTGPADGISKVRHIEMMFLDHVKDPGNFNAISGIWSSMESVAEDFIRKIRTDRKNRKDYPFLGGISGMELDYVENIVSHLWGVLLSFDYGIPFSECIAPGRFV